MKQYDNCLSLGWFCGTASSLSKLGLRNFSGPFDWYFSDFDSVINQIDNEFVDFMKRENLEMVENEPKEFRDKKYNFHYNHDIKENFDKEYDDIYEKYNKRAKRFIENIKNPACFFRLVRSEEEIEYIVNNADYIESVLKRYNSNNSIVYILLNNMSSLPENFKWFRLTSEEYVGGPFVLRHMFDQSMELLQFCETLLKPEQIKINKKFDKQQNAITDANYYIANDMDGIDKKILEMFDLPDNESFYIWGGGQCGISLYRYLLKRKINIKAVIDNRPKNEFPSDICVISPNEIEPYSRIFIAVVDEKSNFEIKEQIKDRKCHILTYRELAYNIE